MAEQKATLGLGRVLFVAAAIGFSAWYWWGGGLQQQATHVERDSEQHFAADMVTQYGMAQRGGDAIEVCVHAGLVATAYLQAHDEPSYQHWKQVERIDCAAAGIPK